MDLTKEKTIMVAAKVQGITDRKAKGNLDDANTIYNVTTHPLIKYHVLMISK